MLMDPSSCRRESINSSGAVARDTQGHVIISAGSLVLGCSSAEEAEASARWSGLQILLFSTVIIESNCAAVLDDFSSAHVNKSRWWSLFSEPCTLIKQQFVECVLQKICRDRNTVAHEVASHGSMVFLCCLGLLRIELCMYT